MIVTQPQTWPTRLLTFAVEAMTRQPTHKARATRLIAAGLAVEVQGRIVLKLPVRDALNSYMRRTELSPKEQV